MNKVIEFPDIEDLQIQMERTEDFYKAARALSDYLKPLPLSQSENDILVELIIRQVETAEQGAFIQGFHMGRDYANSVEKHDDSTEGQNVPPFMS